MMPSDILNGALMIISQGHWIQGSYHDHKGGCCLVGALQLSAYDGKVFAKANYDRDLAKKWAYRYLEEAVDPGNPDHVSLEDWNDDPVRTLASVQQALNRASQLAQAAEKK